MFGFSCEQACQYCHFQQGWTGRLVAGLSGQVPLILKREIMQDISDSDYDSARQVRIIPNFQKKKNLCKIKIFVRKTFFTLERKFEKFPPRCYCGEANKVFFLLGSRRGIPLKILLIGLIQSTHTIFLLYNVCLLYISFQE